MALTWQQHQQNIFAGESGGDYDALYGYQNRSDGKFEGIKVSEMPIADVIKFTSPTGEYGQYVKGQVGRVATPVGAYQVVGSTLRGAVEALGLDPSQKFDKATQDKIGQYILKTQGTGAWEGYGKGGAAMAQEPQKPQGLLGGLLGGQGIGERLGLSPEFSDKLAMAVMAGTGDPSLRPLIVDRAASLQERRDKREAQTKANVTASYIEGLGDKKLAQLVRDGGISGADALTAITKNDKKFVDIEKYKLAQAQGYEGTFIDFTKDLAQIEKTGEVPAGLEAMNKKFGEELIDLDLVGLGEARFRTAKIKTVLDQLEAGEDLTGPLQAVIGELGRSIYNPKSQQAKDLVESVIQTSLRETLGGQFAQKEGEALIKRAYNIALPPEENAARLRALLAQLEASAASKTAMAEYYRENNFSLAGYKGSKYTPTVEDLYSAIDSASAEFKSDEPKTSQTAPAAKPVVINGYTIEEIE
jgi:hypothetical protein